MKKYTFIALTLFLIVTSISTASAQFLPTMLRVTVLDEVGNIVEGATVTLYASEEDYIEEKDPAFESVVSNKKGRAMFKKLDATQYFIHVEKGNLDNIGEGVSTSALKEGKVNLVNIIIRE